MLSILYDVCVDPLGLPIHDLWEYLMLVGIGVAAYYAAWEVSPCGSFGPAVRWIVRLVIFAALWAIAYVLLAAVQWLAGSWLPAMLVSAGVILLFMVFSPRGLPDCA